MNSLRSLEFDAKSVVRKSLRDAYSDALIEKAQVREDFVVFDSDLARSTTTDRFRKAYPERFFNAGIAEQNMVGMAAGLSLTGLIPFITTYSIFIGRAFDQIRQSVCYAEANVKIIATHAGLACAFDGGSHQGLEDLALMRVLPGMTIFCPADYKEAKEAIALALDRRGPVYVRLQKEPTPVFIDSPLGIGEVKSWGSGRDICIISTGSITYSCLKAAQRAQLEGIECRVISLTTIKPLSVQNLVVACEGCDLILTVEEHMTTGGLHEAVCSSFAGAFRKSIFALGMYDQFGETGSWTQLLTKYQLDEAGITAKIRDLVSLNIRP